MAGAVFTAVLCVGIAEMASAFPGAGGPYHYTYMLSSESYRSFLSFLVGWSAVIAWWFIISSAGLFLAAFILGMVILVYPEFAPQPWQVWLVYVAIIILHTVVVLGANSCMGMISSVSLYWSLGAFVVCMITPLAMHQGQPYKDPAFVFGEFTNTSGWSSNGLAFVVGWMLSTFNEEMPQPEKDVPKAMAGAMVAGLVTSFAFLTALLFCITDMKAILDDPTGVPVLAIFYQATGSKLAAIVLCSLISVSICFSELAGILVAGRTTWAFARDNGMPFSKFFSVVDERVKLPVRATLLSSTLSIAYGAIYIGSATAFQSIVGSSIIMLFSTYAIPQAVVAVRGRSCMPARPYDLGKVGWMCNALAPILAVFSIILLCFPSELPVTPKSMNYLSVIVVGCWILIVGFYVLHKKGRYTDPIVQEET
ncbi:hypothetical protein KCU85_g2243, partial [Aureobasidium melanogenum]